jgi:hypothetical protein
MPIINHSLPRGMAGLLNTDTQPPASGAQTKKTSNPKKTPEPDSTSPESMPHVESLPNRAHPSIAKQLMQEMMSQSPASKKRPSDLISSESMQDTANRSDQIRPHTPKRLMEMLEESSEKPFSGSNTNPVSTALPASSLPIPNQDTENKEPPTTQMSASSSTTWNIVTSESLANNSRERLINKPRVFSGKNDTSDITLSSIKYVPENVPKDTLDFVVDWANTLKATKNRGTKKTGEILNAVERKSALSCLSQHLEAMFKNNKDISLQSLYSMNDEGWMISNLRSTSTFFYRVKQFRKDLALKQGFDNRSGAHEENTEARSPTS